MRPSGSFPGQPAAWHSRGDQFGQLCRLASAVAKIKEGRSDLSNRRGVGTVNAQVCLLNFSSWSSHESANVRSGMGIRQSPPKPPVQTASSAIFDPFSAGDRQESGVSNQDSVVAADLLVLHNRPNAQTPLIGEITRRSFAAAPPNENRLCKVQSPCRATGFRILSTFAWSNCRQCSLDRLRLRPVEGKVRL